MALSDLELLQLVERAQDGRKGEQGAQGVGIRSIESLSGESFIITLTDGRTKEIALPRPKDGAVGPAGPRGATGERGSDGRDGQPGIQGRPGRDGVDGSPGRSIETGVVSNGRLLLSLSDGDIVDCGPVVGPQGAPGERGLTGLQGAPGRDGKSILSGGGAPTDGIGAEGDFYIDTRSPYLTIYGPKTGTSWVKMTNLKLDPPPNAPKSGGGSGGGGGGGSSKVATTNVFLNRPARAGVPIPDWPDLPGLSNQMEYNYFTEAKLLEHGVSIARLEDVKGDAVIFDLVSVTAGAISGAGQMSVDSSDAGLITNVKLTTVDKNGIALPFVKDGDTLVLKDRSTDLENRYLIKDASSGVMDMTVELVFNATKDPLVPGATEWEVFLFPTAKTPITVDVSAPLSPEVGDLWFNIDPGSDDADVLYLWNGIEWKPVPFPPSLVDRLDGLTEAVDDKVAKAGDDMSGTLNMKKPRDGTFSNSFVVYGNKDGAEEQPILIDFRKPLGDDTDTEFRYYGLIEDDNALVNKKWIEGNMLKVDGSNATDPIVFPGIVQCADPVDGSDAVTLDYLQSKLPGTSSYISWSRGKTTDRRPRLDVLKGIENYRKILIKQWFYDEDYRPAWGFKMTDGVFWRPNLADNDQGNLHEQRGQDDESMTIVSYTSTDSFGSDF